MVFTHSFIVSFPCSMYQYVIILSIFGAFFFEVSGFQCLLNQMRDSLLPVVVAPEKWQKLCSSTTTDNAVNRYCGCILKYMAVPVSTPDNSSTTTDNAVNRYCGCILKYMAVPVSTPDNSKPENLEAHIHNLAKICSDEINKDDVALWVQRACKKKEGSVSWNEISCLLKRFDASDGCEFNTETNLPTFRTACLWGLWEYYNCLVKDVYNHCGENASNAMRYCTKSFHILVRYTCIKKKNK